MFHCVFSPPCLYVITGELISSHWETLIKPQARYATTSSTSTVIVLELGLGLALGLGFSYVSSLRPGSQNKD